jgi:hypothetical protein
MGTNHQKRNRERVLSLNEVNFKYTFFCKQHKGVKMEKESVLYTKIDDLRKENHLLSVSIIHRDQTIRNQQKEIQTLLRMLQEANECKQNLMSGKLEVYA